MTKYRFISALALAAAAAFPAAAASTHNAITTGQVAAAMAEAGMQISPKQVELLSDVVAATPEPALKIRSMEPWGDHRMMVRLDCAQREECLPFFVAVRFNQGDEIRPIDTDQPPAFIHTRTVVSAPTIRSGAYATLLIDGGHVHIKLSVIAAENGTTGQVIRVSSKDRKQIYTAEVVNGTTLRGSL
jgi:hypothetical protein